MINASRIIHFALIDNALLSILFKHENLYTGCIGSQDLSFSFGQSSVTQKPTLYNNNHQNEKPKLTKKKATAKFPQEKAKKTTNVEQSIAIYQKRIISRYQKICV